MAQAGNEARSGFHDEAQGELQGRSSAGLQVKDLVMVGIFGVILFIVTIVSMTLAGIVPATYPFQSAIAALLGAPLYFLLVSKANKPFVSLLAFGIVGVIWMIWGGYTYGAGMIVGAAVSELVLMRGGYKSVRRLTVAYLCIMLGNFIGDLGVIYINTQLYIDMSLSGSASGASQDYVLAVVDSAKGPVGVAAFAACFVMSVLGALLARRIMRKHFQKAGII
ncbi:MAG: MptD family putative ECF transporter S component [Coriobacteriales bacterium]|jgi:energy-coupling factor transport system substrate-specific component|nr:MptD family putative ECF transporter S component [Coriobacteriales bacterium]